MDIDDRGRRAADSLQRHVTSDLDVDGALDSLGSAPGAGATRVARFATAAFVLALVAGLAVFAADAGRNRDGDRVPDREETAEGDVDLEVDDLSPEELLDIMPAGPLDGKESWRLPVAATPQKGLAHGDQIQVVGRGFFPHDSLGIVQCSAEADTHNAGVDACELGDGFGNVTYADADANGDVIFTFFVRRFITTPLGGRIDCFETAERCLVGVGAISDYDRSGGTYINFAEAAPYPEPSMSIDPGGSDLVPGAPVTAQVDGWIADRPIQFRLCLEPTDHDDISRCLQLAAGKADAAGVYAATFTVPSTVEVDGENVDCSTCVIQATGIGVGGATSQIFPDPIPVSFDLSGPEGPETEGSEPEVPPVEATTSTPTPPLSDDPTSVGPAVDPPVTTDPTTATTHPSADPDA